MEKLPSAKLKFDFESDEIRSQAIEEAFSNLKLTCETKLQELRSEIDKINQAEQCFNPLSSKQINYFSQKATNQLSEFFSKLNKELTIKYNTFPIANKFLNVDYKCFKSVKKIASGLKNITSVIEYIESENLIIFGGPENILALDSLTLEKVASIPVNQTNLPVLFQYDQIENILFVCCMNMTTVNAYKYKKKDKTFMKAYELNNHNLPGVASLKIIDNFLLTGGYDKKLTIWNINNQKMVKEVFFDEWLACFEQISSSVILIGGTTNITVFNVAENKIISSYKVHNGPIWQLIYNSLYQLVISGSCDFTVKVSSYKDEGIHILHTFSQNNWSYGVCLLDEEHILTCGKDKVLRVYNVLEGIKVKESKEELEFDGDWITSDVKLHRIFLSETNGTIHIFEEKK